MKLISTKKPLLIAKLVFKQARNFIDQIPFSPPALSLSTRKSLDYCGSNKIHRGLADDQ